MTLGKRIKAARERLKPKLTQGQVGAAFGISDKAVSAWERDETVPEFGRIAELSRVLKVPCIWLLEGRGSPPSPDAIEVQIESLTPTERPIIEATIKAIRQARDTAA